MVLLKMKKLLIFLAGCKMVVANTYYCETYYENGKAKYRCNTPSQTEQSNSFNNGVNKGTDFNTSGKNAPTINYNTTEAGQAGITNEFDKYTTGHYSKAIMDTSKQGTQDSEDDYKNAANDNNYLYNKGRSRIVQCKNQHDPDPACKAVIKYNDDDTQKALATYNMGTNAFAYSQTVIPDPNNSSCSLIRTYQPINPVDRVCLVGNHQQVDCEATLTPYQQTEKLNPPIPIDGTILQPNASPGVCNVGLVTNSWIPQGDRAWFTITSNAAMFDGLNLPITMGATSGVTPCRSVGGVIRIVPTYTRDLIGQFYMDWFGSQRGNVAFYQEAGQNCGIDNTTTVCTIKITLAWLNGGTFTSWVVNFRRPITSQLVTHYQYNDGCQNYR